MDWQANLITGQAELIALLRGTAQGRGSRHLLGALRWSPGILRSRSSGIGGLEIVPVPVYEPECTQILGQPVDRQPGERYRAHSTWSTSFGDPPISQPAYRRYSRQAAGSGLVPIRYPERCGQPRHSHAKASRSYRITV